MSAAQVIGGVPAVDGPEPKDLPAGGKASAIEVDPIITEGEDGVTFDVEEARARALKALGDESEEGGDKPEEEKKPPKEEPKPETEEEPEEEEDAHTKKLREELTEKDGKLSQDKLERAFAALTKQEKRLKGKVKALGAERDVLVGERERVSSLQKELETERTALAARRDKAKSKPLEALTELGWTYEDLVKYVMADGKVPVEKLVKDATDEGRRQLEEHRRELEAVKGDIEKSKVISAGTDYERKLRASVADALPSFTYISAYETKEVQDLVLEIQTSRYQENKKLPADKQNSIDSNAILKELDDRQAEIVERHAKRLGLKPGQAGAATQNPGTGKSKPLTNEVTSERGRKPAPSEDTPFDREAALAEANRLLQTG